MKQRSLSLDVLRALAVGLVLIHHAKPQWIQALPVPGGLASAIQIGGWVGVDLFFVLSGFLIAGLLFQEHALHGNIDYGRFLLRRGFKIYPAFYVFLGTSLIVLQARNGQLPDGIWGEVFFLQNYVGSVWGHTWSLAVEEHFYLVLPLLLWVISRRRGHSSDPFHWIPRVCLIIGVMALGLRVMNGVIHPSYDSLVHFKPTHVRLDALMFGVYLAYLSFYRSRRFESIGLRYRWQLMVIGLWLMVPAFMSKMPRTPMLYTLGLSQFYLASGAILTSMVVSGIRRNWLTRGLGSIGIYSYSIYLWHYAVKAWGLDLWRMLFGGPMLRGAGAFAFYVVASLAVGILMARLIEGPVLMLRDRWVPSRSRSRVRAAQGMAGGGLGES